MATEHARPTAERSQLFVATTIAALLDAAGGEVILEHDAFEKLLLMDMRRTVHMETLPDGRIRLWLSHGVGKY